MGGTISGDRSFKSAAREAKRRLKNGYWDRLHADLASDLARAKEQGSNQAVVREYYRERAICETRGRAADDAFYAEVKKLLDEEGEVCDAIGRLTDKAYYDTLDYSQKQRYTLELSERYLKAVERYRREKQMKRD